MTKKIDISALPKVRRANLNQTACGAKLGVPTTPPAGSVNADPVSNVALNDGLSTTTTQSLGIKEICSPSDKKGYLMYANDLMISMQHHGFLPVTSASMYYVVKVDSHVRYWLTIVTRHLKSNGIKKSIRALCYDALLIYIDYFFLSTNKGGFVLNKSVENPFLNALSKDDGPVQNTHSWVPRKQRTITLSILYDDILMGCLDQLKFKYSYLKLLITYDAIVFVLEKYFKDLEPVD